MVRRQPYGTGPPLSLVFGMRGQDGLEPQDRTGPCHFGVGTLGVRAPGPMKAPVLMQQAQGRAALPGAVGDSGQLASAVSMHLV